MRKPFIPPGAGPGMAASTVGGPMGDPATMGPQVGRMNAAPPMPMAGNGQPQMGMDMGMGGPMGGGPMGGPPPTDPSMLGGGPTSPFQIDSMLNPQQQPPQQAPPEGPPLRPQTSGADLPDAGEQGYGMSGGQYDRTGPGNSMPMVMLKLMKAMGQLG